MGNTANEDKRTYLSRQTSIDELLSALLNIEKSHSRASGAVIGMNLTDHISNG
jgi:hypothetical protein